MKIRTDFVTNSSSSCYSVTIAAEFANGEKAFFDMAETAGFESPYCRLSYDKLEKAKNIDALIKLINKSVKFSFLGFDDDDADIGDMFGDYVDPRETIREHEEELQHFGDSIKNNAETMQQVKAITVFYETFESGDQDGGGIGRDIAKALWKIKKMYPDLDLSDRSKYPGLLADVKKILKESYYCKENDPEEFLSDYCKLFPEITENYSLDPVVTLRIERFDLSNKQCIEKEFVYGGDKARDNSFGSKKGIEKQLERFKDDK